MMLALFPRPLVSISSRPFAYREESGCGVSRAMGMLVMAVPVVLAIGCGNDAVPKAPARERAAAPAVPGSVSNAGTAAKASVSVPAITAFGKVSDEYRRILAKGDFVADPTGDINRNPFQPFIAIARNVGQVERQSADECARNTVARDATLRDLQLMGIVLRGTRGYALFKDPHGYGHIAHRGDCLSKDKARLKDIGVDRVMLETRGEAPPGGVAPPPIEEVVRLHPEELELVGEEMGLSMTKQLAGKGAGSVSVQPEAEARGGAIPGASDPTKRTK
ncbi:MAG: hypothetical protein V2A73_18635 [Pseudomonadota bacterium]